MNINKLHPLLLILLGSGCVYPGSNSGMLPGTWSSTNSDGQSLEIGEPEPPKEEKPAE